MKKIILWVGVAVVVAGGLGFYAGTLTAGAKSAPGQFAQGAQMGGRRGGAGFQQNGGFINGNIIAKTDNSITVQSRDGSSKIIFFGSSVEILKSVQGTALDLSVGETVAATGTSNSDGSITAENIQIRPAMPAGTPQTTK